MNCVIRAKQCRVIRNEFAHFLTRRHPLEESSPLVLPGGPEKNPEKGEMQFRIRRKRKDEMRRVIVIIGRPGSGKSTLARGLAEKEKLRRFDRDDPEWIGISDRGFIREVEAACMETGARAVIVRTGTTPLARRRIVQSTAPTKVIVLTTPIAVCRERVLARPANPAFGLAGIDDWEPLSKEELLAIAGELH